MSKSTGNYVGIDDPPEDKYGKTMSIPDSAMRNWFELVTRWTPEQIDALIREEVEKLGSKDGGLMMIYGLYPGVSIENTRAVMEAMDPSPLAVKNTSPTAARPGVTAVAAEMWFFTWTRTAAP